MTHEFPVISVIDYGVGNVGSIFNMLRKIGAPAVPARTAADIAIAEKIILPGVGSFDQGMSKLTERGLVDALKERIRGGVPSLGICLGMQLLGLESEEGVLPGLGLLDAKSCRFEPVGDRPLKIPHMGWNEVKFCRESPLSNDLHAQARFYFVHSYHLVCRDPADVLATASFGGDFAAIVQRDNVYGAQFHPEKSHRFGTTLLKNFATLR